MKKGEQTEWLKWVETFGHAFFRKRGKCPNSPFYDGWHRIGVIPMMSVLDGGLAGDSAYEMCLHCGKVFKGMGRFYPKKQPNIIHHKDTKNAKK